MRKTIQAAVRLLRAAPNFFRNLGGRLRDRLPSAAGNIQHFIVHVSAVVYVHHHASDWIEHGIHPMLNTLTYGHGDIASGTFAVVLAAAVFKPKR